MGETTAVAHGGDPQDRAASPVPLLHRFKPKLEKALEQWSSQAGAAAGLLLRQKSETKLPNGGIFV
ncbi:MAG: hypothetical protein F6K65_41160 [Moorea sp. SIO3C2]|nr:hypothetical protein [Moorena sp. SIO3C2]